VPTQQVAFVSERLHRQDVAVRIAMTHRRLQSVAQRLQRTMSYAIESRQTRSSWAAARLGALSPLAVLSRGYALVYDADGTLLRSVANTAVGHTVRARLTDGTLEAEVSATHVEETATTEKRNS
jgi:exodeoxyribonuclease VII large subunit